MLDPSRWDDEATYISSNLHSLLFSVQKEINAIRQACVVAKLEYARQCDELRVANWQESVAAQDRIIAVETRQQHNIVEQTESDLQQVIDERDMIMFLISHKEPE